MSDKLIKEFDKWAIKNDVAYEFAEYINSESLHKIKVLREALAGLYDDNMDYIKINKIGGENNHWLVIARRALKETE